MSPRHRGRRRGSAGGPRSDSRPPIASQPNGPGSATLGQDGVAATIEPEAPAITNVHVANATNGANGNGANGNGANGNGANGNGNGARLSPGLQLGRPQRPPRREPRPSAPAPAAAPETEEPEDESGQPCHKVGCTLAQMRRFIKSRPYVPVHELRRRFLIEGLEDEVHPVPTEKGMLYVGLPENEAGHLAELIKAGEVGYELLLDPASPAVIGVFPMRPVARQ